MSGGNPNGLKENESGGSEISVDHEGDTDHTESDASQRQMPGKHPNGLQGDESRGADCSNTNGNTDDTELGALRQQMTYTTGSQESERRGSEPVVLNNNEDFRDVEFLDLSSASMDTRESQIMARAMERGELKKLEILVMEENHGDLAMRAMLNALRRHYLERLRKLFLWEVSSYDQITVAEEGTEIIADALADGALPNLEVMDLRGFLPKLHPSRRRFEALKTLFTKCSLGEGRLNESSSVCLGCLVCNTRPNTIQTLDCVRCLVGKLYVYSGDTGIRKLGQALKVRPIQTLKELYLQQNYISDKGASDLAKILRRGLLPSLERLDLLNNPVGREGAENIIFAFLRNPLLTARVHMKWKNRLQRQRYVAFRESNIRLEVRLKDADSDIEASQVAKEKFDYPQYSLCSVREQSGRKSRAHPYRLRLLCQARSENREKDHEVKIWSRKESGFIDPDGIEFRVLPIFTTSPPAYVDREPEESVAYSGPMKEEQSGDLGLQPGLQGKFLTMSGPVSAITWSMQRRMDETVLKRTKGVNRICIKKGSLGFIRWAAAEAFAFDSQDREPSSDSPKSLIERLRKWGVLGEGKKTNEAMKTIVQELLMLADRKPDEFFHMFGLRQVLLKNPTLVDDEEGLYSRRWICNSCFGEYRRRDPHLVFPITTEHELGLM